MTHRHFCLDALSGKCLEIITRKGGKLSHLIAILVLQRRTNLINFHLSFHSGHSEHLEFC